jgi:hypothetical protein
MKGSNRILLSKRTRTRARSTVALSSAVWRLQSALERATAQRVDLTLTASTLAHHASADRLQTASVVIASLLDEAIDLLGEASAELPKTTHSSRRRTRE